MNWNNLTSVEQLETIVNTESHRATILLFKHSTTCSISAAALNRVERNWKDDDTTIITPYYLDLLNHRDISTHIATLTGVKHESPQVIIVKNGVATYNTSHSGIRYDDIMDNV
jgi:bacillithiol system protein YtxJ